MLKDNALDINDNKLPDTNWQMRSLQNILDFFYYRLVK